MMDSIGTKNRHHDQGQNYAQEKLCTCFHAYGIKWCGVSSDWRPLIMPRNQVLGLSLLVILGTCFSGFAHAAPAGACQAAEPPKKVEPGQHGQHEHHHLHMTMGEEKCDPKVTYD